MTTRRRYLLISACALTWAVGDASAQSATARGEALFKQGVELRNAGRTAEACEAFAASDKTDPNLGTLMYLADCREANNELASAWGGFLEAEKRTRNATDDESMQINASARERAARLEPRLSRLKLVVPESNRVPGLEIVVGTESFSASSWNLEVPIDGKTHAVSVRAPDYLPWTTTITIAPERDSKSVDIPRLIKAPVRPKPVDTRTIVIHETGPSPWRHALPFAVAGTSAVLIGTAIWFEGSSARWYDHAEVEENDAQQTADWEKAKSQRYKAIGFGTAGVACGAIAAWLWLRGDPVAPARTALQPVVSSGFVGAQVGGAW